jgi:hypothetical protein
MKQDMYVMLPKSVTLLRDKQSHRATGYCVVTTSDVVPAVQCILYLNNNKQQCCISTTPMVM